MLRLRQQCSGAELCQLPQLPQAVVSSVPNPQQDGEYISLLTNATLAAPQGAGTTCLHSITGALRPLRRGQALADQVRLQNLAAPESKAYGCSNDFGKKIRMTSTLLGAGAFGEVYLGIHEKTGAWVAIKKVRLAVQSSHAEKHFHLQLKGCKVEDVVDEQIDGIVQEIRLMRELVHPNIVKYFHAERHGQEVWVYMEYMSGGSLGSLLKKLERLSESMLRVYMRQVIEGVTFLHQRSVVHRDIKPDNILLNADGTAKLSDFGTSREQGDATNLLTLTGTPWFMAPEVVKSIGHGTAADIWSLGCSMIQLTTGRPPFHDCSGPMPCMYQIGVNPQRVLEYIPKTISEDLHQLMTWCLQDDPSKRPSAAALLRHQFFSCEDSSDSAE